MNNDYRSSDHESKSKYELIKEANKILHENGLSTRGRPLRLENWDQYKFELNMQRGAYCSRRKR